MNKDSCTAVKFLRGKKGIEFTFKDGTKFQPSGIYTTTPKLWEDFINDLKYRDWMYSRLWEQTLDMILDVRLSVKIQAPPVPVELEPEEEVVDPMHQPPEEIPPSSEYDSGSF